MKDFLAFRTMVTPVIIQVIFWVGVVLCIIIGLFLLVLGNEIAGYKSTWTGLGLIFLGPLGVRIYCEILIIFFRINETLTEMKHLMEERRQGTV
ncbi:MAG: DUF4282 domain-containing protein [Deltaproteobacteria bacterium]|nr:DUF4282 domain-containing protein [Deltaproteobacteria bacterium]